MSLPFKERAENYKLEEILSMHQIFQEFDTPSKSITNPYSKILSEYFLSDDREPRVFTGRPGSGKTMSYIESLIELVPQHSQLLPTAVIYKNFNERRILDHRKLATEGSWGSQRLGIIDSHKNSIPDMLQVSNINIFDDMGYLFEDVINNTYELKKLNDNLEEIIHNINEGKKVLIMTNAELGIYAEKIELMHLRRHLPMGEVKRLNDILPKFGYRNPLHANEYKDLNYMPAVEVSSEGFIYRVNGLFQKSGIVVSAAQWVEKGIIREEINGLSFIYQLTNSPRKFITLSNRMLQMITDHKQNSKHPIIGVDELKTAAESLGMDIDLKEPFGRRRYGIDTKIYITLQPSKPKEI